MSRHGARDALLPPRTRAAGLLLLLLLLLGLGCDGPREDVRVIEPGGAVAAGTPAATRIGLDVLARGGNAADAAVAVSLALAVSEPGQSGLGGYGVAVVVDPGGGATALHASVLPMRADGGVGPEGVGGRSGATVETGDPDREALPALVPVLERLWRRHGSGRLSWEELVEPARELAADGFRLTRYAHRTLVREYPRLLEDPVARRTFLAEGRALPPEGTEMTRPDLAATLDRLAARGPAELQRGQLATQLLEWARGAGVELQTADLSRVVPVETPLVRASYRGWTVFAPAGPFPGDVLVDALARLSPPRPEGIGAGGEGGTVRLAEALAEVYRLTPPEEAGAPTTSSPADAAGSHFSIVDPSGGAVSMTQSLGRPYGAGTVAGRLGFFLGSLRDAPRSAVGEGGGTEAGELRPTSPATSRATPPATAPDTDRRTDAPPTATLPLPVVAHSPDGGILVLGSGGGMPPTSAVVQVLVAALAEPGIALSDAVVRPRLHPAPGSGGRHRLYLEGPPWVVGPSTGVPPRGTAAPPSRADRPSSGQGGATGSTWSPELRSELEARGFLPVQRDAGLLFEGLSPWFGGVNAVLYADGRWTAVADPRRDGMGLTAEMAPTQTPGEEEAPLRPARGARR